MSGPSSDVLLSVDAVAAYLAVSTRTVRRIISRGELVSHRIGRALRVDAASVAQLLEATRVVASPGTPCRTESEGMSGVRPTYSGDADGPRLGRASSTGRRFRSGPLTQPRPSSGSPTSSLNARRAERENAGPAPIGLGDLGHKYFEHIKPPRLTEKTACDYENRVLAFVAWAEQRAPRSRLTSTSS